MSDNEEFEECTPPDIREAAAEVTSKLIPKKSEHTYEMAYANFNEWKKSKNISSSSETILSAYFNELSKKYKPSSLWSFYSMLKTMMSLHEKIDIKGYNKLLGFLKNNAKGFKSKQSKVFTPDEMRKFLLEAPDNEYLATKVAFIFGICGACRGDELVKMTVQDISTEGNLLLVKLPVTKTDVLRSFAIDPEFSKIVKKYRDLRPANASSDRFFLNYQRGRCTNQVIGKNKFAGFPKEIATYLQLPDPELYTGHSFRRSSTTILANTGASMTTIKRHGGCKSTSVSERYIEDSILAKAKVGNSISAAVNLPVAKPGEESATDPSKRQKINVINLGTSSSKENSTNDQKIFKFDNCNITFNFKEN